MPPLIDFLQATAWWTLKNFVNTSLTLPRPTRTLRLEHQMKISVDHWLPSISLSSWCNIQSTFSSCSQYCQAVLLKMPRYLGICFARSNLKCSGIPNLSFQHKVFRGVSRTRVKLELKKSEVVLAWHLPRPTLSTLVTLSSFAATSASNAWCFWTLPCKII